VAGGGHRYGGLQGRTLIRPGTGSRCGLTQRVGRPGAGPDKGTARQQEQEPRLPGRSQRARLRPLLSLSISQAFDSHLIVAMKYQFSLPNKVRLITVKDRKPLYLIETYNRKSLTAIIEFFSRKDLIGLGLRSDPTGWTTPAV
jgi:hypothetical protein